MNPVSSVVSYFHLINFKTPAFWYKLPGKIGEFLTVHVRVRDMPPKVKAAKKHLQDRSESVSASQTSTSDSLNSLPSSPLCKVNQFASLPKNNTSMIAYVRQLSPQTKRTQWTTAPWPCRLNKAQRKRFATQRTSDHC